MTEEVEDVRAALRKRLGDDEKEIELMLGRYVGQHRTVRSFFRTCSPHRSGAQAPEGSPASRGSRQRISTFRLNLSLGLFCFVCIGLTSLARPHAFSPKASRRGAASMYGGGGRDSATVQG